MKSIDEIVLEEHQIDLETMRKSYLALRNELREAHDHQKPALERKEARLKAEIENLEKNISNLKSRGEYAWRLSLYKIDFNEARRAVDPALSYLRKSRRVVVMFLHNSKQMMGDYGLDQFEKEWLSTINSYHRTRLPVRIEGDRKTDFIRCLAREAKMDEDGEAPELKSILSALFLSVRTGVLLITLNLDGDLKQSPGLLKDFICEQLIPDAREALALCPEEYGARHVVIVLTLSHQYCHSFDSDTFCCGGFQDNLIFEIPTMAWSKDDVKEWLGGHSGLDLSEYQIEQIAAEVIANSRDIFGRDGEILGKLPRDVDLELRLLLNQYTEDRVKAVSAVIEKGGHKNG